MCPCMASIVLWGLLRHGHVSGTQLQVFFFFLFLVLLCDYVSVFCFPFFSCLCTDANSVGQTYNIFLIFFPSFCCPYLHMVYWFKHRYRRITLSVWDASQPHIFLHIFYVLWVFMFFALAQAPKMVMHIWH